MPRLSGEEPTVSIRTQRTTYAVATLLVAALCLSGCAANRCPVSNEVPNARYVGPYLGVENNLSSSDFARDIYCSNEFKAKNFPNGYVTVYGSSKIQETNDKGPPEVNRANDKLYAQILSFATTWTSRYGNIYPIMTGAGPGLMEAASRGAHKAGKSIGYTTYYDHLKADPKYPYGGDPTRAFNKYNSADDVITDGLIFSSIAMREDAMILHSAAIVIAPGGTGTEWETFQILETVRSHQLTKVPVYIVGDREMYWKSFLARLCDMDHHKTLNRDDLGFVEYVNDPEDVIDRLTIRLVGKTGYQPPEAPVCPPTG
jgi:predicted Rossmann-fold nucleotide-binding protein